MAPRRRPANREAPIYDDKKFCTLKLHYGGKFVHLPTSYEGGDVIFIDYVEHKSLSLALMDKMVQECGLHGITLFYRIDELKKFRLMRSEIDLYLMLGAGLVSMDTVEFSVYLSHEPMERLDEEGNGEKVLEDYGMQTEDNDNGMQTDHKVDSKAKKISKAKDKKISKAAKAKDKKVSKAEDTNSKRNQEDELVENSAFWEQVDQLVENITQVSPPSPPLVVPSPQSPPTVVPSPPSPPSPPVVADYVEDSDSEYVEESDPTDDDELFDGNVDELFDGNVDPDIEENHNSGDESFSDGGGILDSNDELNWEPDGEETVSVFDPATILNPRFQLEQIFSSRKEFRQAVQSHAVNTMRNIKITTNEVRRIYAKCVAEGCQWHLHALKMKDDDAYQIRDYDPNHSCGSNAHCKNVKSSWLAKKYEDAFRSDPNRSVKGFRLDCIRDIKCHISKQQAYRAKRQAITSIEGDYDEQYNKLWDYAAELRRQNPGSTIILNQSEESDSNGRKKFKRLYVGLKPMRDGFLAACRPFIGVDGTWLKGPHTGILLTAVGVDPNNSLYPIAYAIVLTESKVEWKWFLELLREDLNIERPDAYTFISDKQKGLVPAFKAVFPGAENRFCVKHLVDNMQKSGGFKEREIEMALWGAAKATNIPQFEKKYKKFLEMESGLTEWMEDKPPCQWSRSHMSTYSKCDAILNNICETFNGNLMEARERPILTCLEWIRQHIMVRFQQLRDKAKKKWGGQKICPRIRKILEKRMQTSANCIPLKSNDCHFEIHCSEGEQYTVDLEKHSCSCRAWDLSGIPCTHAMSAINYMVHNPEDYVNPCYTVEAFNRAYEPHIMPLNGPQMWTKTGKIPPLPPSFGRKKGRPTKARRRSGDEPKKGKQKKSTGGIKMKKQSYKMTCQYCGVRGHNRNGCQKRKTEENEGAQESPQSEEPQTEAPINLPAQKLKVKRGGKTNATSNDVSNVPTAVVPPKVNKRKKSCEASGSGKVNKRDKSNGVNDPSSAPTEMNIDDDAPLPSQVQSQPDFITPSFPLPPSCNPIAPTLNIRGHAPTSFQPNPGAPPPFPVTVIDGKKYVTLANLPAACKTLKSAKNLK